jgi:CMP/dCMP kinase
MNRRSIVVNGDLGSGKSTVSREIAARLRLRYVSVGDLYREIARTRGMSALELNLHAELDEEVDNYVDQLQSKIARSGEQLVVDSRLAWFFFADAFKVHLVTDPAVAARRVLARPGSGVESYAGADEARQSLRSRSESERVRFLSKYGADKTRLRNYDLICDTTRAAPGLIADRVLAAYDGSPGDEVAARPLLLLDPARVYPTEKVSALCEPDGADPGVPAGAAQPVTIGYSAPYFYAIDGHRTLSAAISGGAELVTAWLLAEGDEQTVGGLTAHQHFTAEVSLSAVYDWEEAHGVELALPPHLAPLAGQEGNGRALSSR